MWAWLFKDLAISSFYAHSLTKLIAHIVCAVCTQPHSHIHNVVIAHKTHCTINPNTSKYKNVTTYHALFWPDASPFYLLSFILSSQPYLKQKLKTFVFLLPTKQKKHTFFNLVGKEGTSHIWSQAHNLIKNLEVPAFKREPLLSKTFWFVYIHQNHLNLRLWFPIFDTCVGTLTGRGACTHPRSGETWGETAALKPASGTMSDTIIVWICNMSVKRGFWVRVFQIRGTTKTVVKKMSWLI